MDVSPAAIKCRATAGLGRNDKTEGGSGDQMQVRVVWYTELVRGRQLAKTDHKRTSRIIGMTGSRLPAVRGPPAEPPPPLAAAASPPEPAVLLLLQ